MENYEHYEALAESIFFRGISASAVPQIARYREGKSFNDLKTAVQNGLRESAGRSAEAMFGNLAIRLFEVVEIDASAPVYEFEKKLMVCSPEPART